MFIDVFLEKADFKYSGYCNNLGPQDLSRPLWVWFGCECGFGGAHAPLGTTTPQRCIVHCAIFKKSASNPVIPRGLTIVVLHFKKHYKTPCTPWGLDKVCKMWYNIRIK